MVGGLKTAVTPAGRLDALSVADPVNPLGALTWTDPLKFDPTRAVPEVWDRLIEKSAGGLLLPLSLSVDPPLSQPALSIPTSSDNPIARTVSVRMRLPF